MSDAIHIDHGIPSLLAFSGPDAVRFLNGQITQDVRRVAHSEISLPACITDAKGRLQFRVWLHARGDALMVEGPHDLADDIEARLTRYLIADDVTVENLSGQWRLHHLIGHDEPAPAGVIVRQSSRFGESGSDWWVPADSLPPLPPSLSHEAVEQLRITRGIPAWGCELTPGILPPEAGLETSDISYHKGCYIGQEVISRIKSAGKVNQRLARMSWDAAIAGDQWQLVDDQGQTAGTLTSVAPMTEMGQRHALGFIKRGAQEIHLQSPDEGKHPLTVAVV